VDSLRDSRRGGRRTCDHRVDERNGVARKVQGSNGPRVQGSWCCGDTERVDSTAAATVGPAGPTRRRQSLPTEDFGFSSRAVTPLEEVVPLSIEPIQPIGVSIAPITDDADRDRAPGRTGARFASRRPRVVGNSYKVRSKESPMRTVLCIAAIAVVRS
jgi:hypothetical protein